MFSYVLYFYNSSDRGPIKQSENCDGENVHDESQLEGILFHDGKTLFNRFIAGLQSMISHFELVESHVVYFFCQKKKN